MQMNKPLIIAHRGDHTSGQLENSLPAFASAIQLGADGLEVDVQLHEGRLILKHNIDAHMPPVVDDFASFLALVKETNYHGLLLIELKGKQGAAQLYRELQAAQVDAPVMLQSFQVNALETWRRLDKTIPLGLLQHRPNRLSRQLFQAGVIQNNNLDYRYLPFIFARAREVVTYWWTPTKAWVLKMMFMARVAGVITDDVRLAQQIRDRDGK